MAYVSQECKARLAKEIAKVIPPTWKYTLAVRHHSTLVLNIRSADVDLLGENLVVQRQYATEGRADYRSLNEYYLEQEYSGKLLETFKSIKDAMMVGNHDNSDIQSDYHDVGWYIDINIGNFHSPFRFVPKPAPAQPKASRPKGMPEGLSAAQEIAWLKQRVAELEGRR